MTGQIVLVVAAVPCSDSTGTAGEVKKIFLTPFLPA